ncbi:unnamed protein product [Protopolystoma xenopodis]|uniref:Macroglobulin domain-containing protein n=1 Tax=Protopolystoma xenopodis TaxID=117903 RepID=A0A448WW20_9PLAT|nr:unnamed protein product [Protopolystoma xenopodis]
MRLGEDEFALYGLIAANYTSGKAVRGNATVQITLRESTADKWSRPPRVAIQKSILEVSLSE